MREFVDIAAQALGMNIIWKGEGINETGVDSISGKTIVKVDPGYFRPTEVETLLGNPAKAKEKLGWQATTSFKQLVHEMVKSDLEEAEKDALCHKEGFKVYRYYE